jgi:hypothetical protein
MLPISSTTAPRGIDFGTPSSTGATSEGSPSGLASNLLKQASSGGIASVLSGGLGSIAGIGGLVSSLVGLFGGGGKSDPPPLVNFQLPAAQAQTLSLSSRGGGLTNVEHQNVSSFYSGSNPASSPQPMQYQTAQIAEAVKKALLNSSSLNDVIAEI